MKRIAVAVMVLAGCSGGTGTAGEAVECSSWAGTVIDAGTWAAGCSIDGTAATGAVWTCTDGTELAAYGDPGEGGVWSLAGGAASIDADEWSDVFWSCQG